MLGTLTDVLGDATASGFFYKPMQRGPHPWGGLARRRLIVPSFRVAVSLECGPGIALLNELSFSSIFI